MKTYTISVPINACCHFNIKADDEELAKTAAIVALATDLNIRGIRREDVDVKEDPNASITTRMRWDVTPTALDANVLASEEYVREMLVNLMEEEIYEEAEFRCDAEEDVDALFDDVLDEIVRAMRKDGAFRKKLGETLFDGSHMASILQSDIDSAITGFATEYLRSNR